MVSNRFWINQIKFLHFLNPYFNKILTGFGRLLRKSPWGKLLNQKNGSTNTLKSNRIHSNVSKSSNTENIIISNLVHDITINDLGSKLRGEKKKKLCAVQTESQQIDNYLFSIIFFLVSVRSDENLHFYGTSKTSKT